MEKLQLWMEKIYLENGEFSDLAKEALELIENADFTETERDKIDFFDELQGIAKTQGFEDIWELTRISEEQISETDRIDDECFVPPLPRKSAEALTILAEEVTEIREILYDYGILEEGQLSRKLNLGEALICLLEMAGLEKKNSLTGVSL